MGLRLLAAAGAATGLVGMVLIPFGPVSKLGNGQTWYGHRSESVWTNTTRVQKLKMPSAEACEQRLVKFSKLDFGDSLDPKSETTWRSWYPWSKEDLDGIRDCESFPCNYKLNASEVAKVAKASPTARRDQFLEVVRTRVLAYQKTQKRLEYEFPGNPLDPWKWFSDSGFRSQGKMAEVPELTMRKLDLAPGKMKPLRQVLDRRIVKAPHEVTFWIRDAYTSHYFDGWGEWHQASCDPKTHLLTLVQSLFVEVDLYKKGDVFSKLSRGRLRSAIEEYGKKYLDMQN